MRGAGKRRLLVRVAVASLAVVCVTVLAVPATRDGAFGLWCELTGAACPPRVMTPPVEPDRPDGQVKLPPEDAATWGNYVALGDSYSSGHGAGDYRDGTNKREGCWRSSNAYPATLAENHDFAGSLGFYACSAQRGASMLDDIGSEDSQIDGVTPHTSLVTLGVGGNDLGFWDVLRTCMARLPLTKTTACVDQQDEIDSRMERFRSTFGDLLGEIRERAPDARVVVLGYPRLFPAKPSGMYYTLSVEDQKWLNTNVKRFNRHMKKTVARADARIVRDRSVGSMEFVDLYSAFDGHEVNTDGRWINGVLLHNVTEGVRVDRGTFHPNAEGQNAFRERVSQHVDDGPGRALYARRGTVDNADPGVLASEIR